MTQHLASTSQNPDAVLDAILAQNVKGAAFDKSLPPLKRIDRVEAVAVDLLAATSALATAVDFQNQMLMGMIEEHCALGHMMNSNFDAQQKFNTEVADRCQKMGKVLRVVDETVTEMRDVVEDLREDTADLEYDEPEGTLVEDAEGQPALLYDLEANAFNAASTPVITFAIVGPDGTTTVLGGPNSLRDVSNHVEPCADPDMNQCSEGDVVDGGLINHAPDQRRLSDDIFDAGNMSRLLADVFAEEDSTPVERCISETDEFYIVDLPDVPTDYETLDIFMRRVIDDAFDLDLISDDVVAILIRALDGDVTAPLELTPLGISLDDHVNTCVCQWYGGGTAGKLHFHKQADLPSHVATLIASMDMIFMIRSTLQGGGAR